jgi:hypothetical protein
LTPRRVTHTRPLVLAGMGREIEFVVFE